jgi:hypothetical protein
MKYRYLAFKIFFAFSTIKSTSTFAQISSIYLHTSSGLYSRLLQQGTLDDTEFNYLKKNEKLRPSFSCGFGIDSRLNTKNNINFEVNYQRIRFGTGKFKIPSNVVNITPQYGITKHIVVVDYFTLNTSIQKNIKKINDKSTIFVKYGAGLSFKINHFLRENTYEKDGSIGFEGKAWSIFQHYPKTNIALNGGCGVNYKIGKHYSLSIAPVFEVFLKKFKTPETPNWDYQFFKKPTIGYLNDFSLDIKLHRNF